MIKAVIFDLDGVIVDSEPAYKNVDMRILDYLGISLTSSEYDKWMGTSGEEMFKCLKEEYGFSQSVFELTKMQGDFMMNDFKEGKFGPIEGAVELIKYLYENKNCSLAVASSSPVAYINRIIEALNISNCFDAVLSGETLEKTKPAPDIYIECAVKLNVSPLECIAIEDSKNGITAAKDAGMKCVAFLSSKDRNQANDRADYVFDRMNDIQKLFTGLI